MKQCLSSWVLVTLGKLSTLALLSFGVSVEVFSKDRLEFIIKQPIS